MRETLFRLNPIEGVSLQSQICEMLVSAILSRHLAPGARLPSSRTMARQLDVSRNTVTLAYQSLISSGYLEARDRSGTYVGGEAPVARLSLAQPMPAPDLAVDWQARLVRRCTPLHVVEKPLNWREFAYPFVYGQADLDLFSHSDWRECARQALGQKNFGVMAGDFGLSDDPLLIEYIRTRTLPRRGIRAETDQIMVTLGAQNALYLLSNLLVDRKTEVVIEEPGYPDLRNILALRQPRVRHVPLDLGGLPLGPHLDDAGIVFITPSHQSPTTVTMPLDRRRDLLAAAAEHDFVIVEDDYEFEMSYLAKPTPALKSLDADGRVIYVGSFSKSLFPGLRLGYLVGPTPLIHEARALRQMMLRHPPGHLQRTTAYFLAFGHYDTLVRRLRNCFAERRQVMQAALARCERLQFQASSFGGTSFWVEGPQHLDSRVLAATLQERGVLLEPGDIFFGQSNPPGNFFRLAYSSVPTERIEPGVRLLVEAIQQLCCDQPGGQLAT